MSRIEAGTLESSIQTNEDVVKKAANSIKIDENLLAPEIHHTAKIAVMQNIKTSLKIDIPESWNGLHGDISRDPIALSLIKRLEAGTLEASI